MTMRMRVSELFVQDEYKNADGRDTVYIECSRMSLFLSSLHLVLYWHLIALAATPVLHLQDMGSRAHAADAKIVFGFLAPACFQTDILGSFVGP